MARTLTTPDPNRSAGARLGHERRARRKRLARMLGARLRRLAAEGPATPANWADEPEAFAEWIVGQAAEAATEWDEPDLVGGDPTPVLSMAELTATADELIAESSRDALRILEDLEPDGEVDATIEATIEATDDDGGG
jgi:hypothetical protein